MPKRGAPALRAKPARDRGPPTVRREHARRSSASSQTSPRPRAADRSARACAALQRFGPNQPATAGRRPFGESMRGAPALRAKPARDRGPPTVRREHARHSSASGQTSPRPRAADRSARACAALQRFGPNQPATAGRRPFGESMRGAPALRARDRGPPTVRREHARRLSAGQLYATRKGDRTKKVNRRMALGRGRRRTGARSTPSASPRRGVRSGARAPWRCRGGRRWSPGSRHRR